MNLKSGYPYWLVKNGLLYDYPKLDHDLKTDVTIMGGGISGALTAHYLTEAGMSCVVVDSHSIGLGSTCASTSLLQYELDHPLSELIKAIGKNAAQRSYLLCNDAIDELEKISHQLKFTSFKKNKSLYFSASTRDVAALHKEFEERKKCGLSVHLLDKTEIKKKYGFDSGAAILSDQGASTDAYSFAHALHQFNKKKGLKIFDRTRVTKMERKRKKLQLVTKEGCKIKTQFVVNATGYEAAKDLPKKMVEFSSTYAIASENLSSGEIWKDRAMMWNTADPYLYLRPTSENRIIIGGRDEPFRKTSSSDRLIEKKSVQLRKDFSKMFPTISFIPEFSWCGTFVSTRDSLPYIGLKNDSVYHALGFGGNGIVFSLIAAQLITDMILGKKNNNEALFSFNR